MTPKLVIVSWNDAQATATRVYVKERDHVPTVMHTVGWLLDQDDRGVSVACERFEEDGQWSYRGHTFVPAGMLIKVRRAT